MLFGSIIRLNAIANLVPRGIADGDGLVVTTGRYNINRVAAYHLPYMPTTVRLNRFKLFHRLLNPNQFSQHPRFPIHGISRYYQRGKAASLTSRAHPVSLFKDKAAEV